MMLNAMLDVERDASCPIERGRGREARLMGETAVMIVEYPRYNQLNVIE